MRQRPVLFGVWCGCQAKSKVDHLVLAGAFPSYSGTRVFEDRNDSEIVFI